MGSHICTLLHRTVLGSQEPPSSEMTGTSGPPPPGQPAASGRLMWGYNKGALLSLGETDSEAISTPGLRAQVGSG